MVNPNGTQKCAHSGCSCIAPMTQGYCSEACRHDAMSGAPREEKVCNCEHKGCTGKR
jgi:hypothetical protein